MQPSSEEKGLPGPSSATALALGAVGVVYGDIGTSPLYTLKEVFAGPHPILPSPENVLGILSLIFWSLFIVVSLKYVVFIMRADNEGEGGIMAMMALVQNSIAGDHRARWFLMVLGLFGAALFYGDGIITPAISVLSAVEGLKVATPALTPLVIPLALGILIGLFMLQRRGTARMGVLFGPVMVIWFLTLGGLGLLKIIQVPSVLEAVNPWYALNFFLHHKAYAFLALGAVVLAVTGAEALYADMGHFGKKPIRLAWFILVLPALLLNYFGQGALIITTPEALENPFYKMAPDSLIYPMIALATAATIIASQAVISGAFSVTRQAIQLGYLPRMEIHHTSQHAAGQIYVPFINWTLAAGIVLLVLGFQSSSHLAAAYGVAVTATMAIDTILGFVVVLTLWRWNRWIAIFGLACFLAVDLSFFGANLLKIAHGGWFPLAVGLAVFTLLSTWQRGRRLLRDRLLSTSVELEPFLEALEASPPIRVPGTAVFLNSNPDVVPHALLHNLNHNKVLHKRVIFVTVLSSNVPYVPRERRSEMKKLGENMYRVLLHYGFMQEPHIPLALTACADCGGNFNLLETSFFFSRETIIPSKLPGMALWRERIFVWMARNAQNAMRFFRIPTNRVIELGTQVVL
ncbi:MAG: potassium transporter Kup [Gammaproteobacteria bacterium RIFOXYA12_FULL_61_12]|nr:MAG: potassium transporter Kup [Gammaproteobacteria bacterium RIFOXYD12_FULL_61_37]OGT92946.1 MAG: potassium transporter Kup [Gammaproteobacteria bacterium RIFOXYA12_FULL_61_12]